MAPMRKLYYVLVPDKPQDNIYVASYAPDDIVESVKQRILQTLGRSDDENRARTVLLKVNIPADEPSKVLRNVGELTTTNMLITKRIDQYLPWESKLIQVIVHCRDFNELTRKRVLETVDDEPISKHRRQDEDTA
ncbi:hypothetical protein FRB99_000032 [Tulasnella sp. 403]|nr:hypothetical protein FRB99_000032 [Tulasnella sp. 403]